VVHPEVAERVVLGGRGRAPDLGAAVLGDLGRGDADAARRGVDEGLLARLQGAVAEQRGPRRRVVDRDRGALLEGEAVGERDRVLGAGDDLLGVAAELAGGDHAVADRGHRDALADLRDDARDLVADHARRRGRVGVQALTRHDLGEVQARRPDLDADLARADDGVGALLDGQHVRGSMPGDDDRPHGGTIPADPHPGHCRQRRSGFRGPARSGSFPRRLPTLTP
jgi:hypothetical protein